MEKGVGVWLRDTESEEWQRAVVLKVDRVSASASSSASTTRECDVRLRLADGRTERTVRVDVLALENESAPQDVMLANSHDMDLVEDLIQLPHLHEPGICHTLNERFKINEIYTLTGEILLAINPFKNIGIYTDKIMRKYIRHGDKRATGVEVADMPPHVFSIADKAFRALMNPLVKNARGTADQSILVSGESGAGKTESTKFVMQYLATIAQNLTHKDSLSQQQQRHSETQRRRSSAAVAVVDMDDDDNVMKQVLSSNPILESFGNARTIRNDNSSRFGKFIKMHFNDRGRLIGAGIQTYLLEKVRLAYQAEAERNYHIFYEIIAGASSVERERWQLHAPSDFHYLNQSTCVVRKDGVDDAAQFRVLKNAMQVMGFSDEDMESIFLTVAMLLHLGNLEFDVVPHAASGVDGSTISLPQCADSLQVVLTYLEIDQAGLEEAICFRKIQAKDETYSIALAPDAAENTRDALARFLYGKLFDWLVARLNEMMHASATTSLAGAGAAAGVRGGFIGLLDIFGFEDLAHNSFEQLCINYANETLQQHFNRTVLRLEQEMYESEKIEWSFINFPDNSACIELIEGKPFGLITALDEECIVPQGNDRNFARKLYRQHKDHAHFSADKTAQANHVFVIHHYAGEVAYDTFGFCEKNKDVLYPEITQLLKRSSRAFVRNLLKVDAAAPVKGRSSSNGRAPVGVLRNGKNNGNGTASRVSLGSQFRTQLKELLETIGATSCHYVRCLKPNDQAAPSLFVPKRICDQLKAGGVLEAVRVNRAGYPVRLTHQQFLKRYRPLANGALLARIPDAAGSDDFYDPDMRKQASQWLVDYLLTAHRERHPEQYEDDVHATDKQAARVAGIQVGLTRVFFRRSAIQFVEAQLAKRYGEFVVLIQASVRGLLARRRYQRMQTACALLQRIVRGHLARCLFLDMKERYRRQQLELAREREREAAAAAAAAAAAKEALAEEEAQNRLTARTTASSDPISDDDDDLLDPQGLRLTDRTTSSRMTARSTARFRFTKDYSDDMMYGRESNRMTIGGGSNGSGPQRSVAMDPGDTVLHVAANCCNEHDVLKLLQNGSDINARNRRGRTPLHTAALHTNLEVVGILLDWEADVCAQDNDGNTPLHLTTDAQIARMLLEAGCTPNIVNADGRTPLIEAVDRGDTQIVKYLMQFKADVLFRELKHHQTALHLAIRRGHYAIVMELCKTEDVKDLILLTDRNENNALHFAVSRDRKNGPRLVDYLIKHGAEVDKVNARFQTPLVVHIMTTRQTDPAITELFLSTGADANVVLADGSTLLHVSVERELIDIACALLKHGADLNRPDDKGRLVVELCDKKYLKKLFNAITFPPSRLEEKARRACMSCNASFKFGSRRHHCRHCMRVCCSDCTAFSIEMFRFPKEFPGRITGGGKSVKDPQRICRTCHAVFKMRSAQKESKSGFMARVLGYEWDEITSRDS
ncbi:hypothetical protein PINS_up013840 [Pythium insidiosum]|nr:hypothetical protein PINS_up013840 [Pythium insidiosum]